MDWVVKLFESLPDIGIIAKATPGPNSVATVSSSTRNVTPLWAANNEAQPN